MPRPTLTFQLRFSEDKRIFSPRFPSRVFLRIDHSPCSYETLPFCLSASDPGSPFNSFLVIPFNRFFFFFWSRTRPSFLSYFFSVSFFFWRFSSPLFGCLCTLFDLVPLCPALKPLQRALFGILFLPCCPDSFCCAFFTPTGAPCALFTDVLSFSKRRLTRFGFCGPQTFPFQFRFLLARLFHSVPPLP